MYIIHLKIQKWCVVKKFTSYQWESIEIASSKNRWNSREPYPYAVASGSIVKHSGFAQQKKMLSVNDFVKLFFLVKT